MTLGDKIKETRENLMLTQSALAARAGISRVSVGNYERGARIPNSTILNRLAKALHTSPDYLLGHTPYSDSDDKTDTLYIENMPEYDYNIVLEIALEKFGYVIQPSIYDYDNEQEQQTKTEEWVNTKNQYFNIIHNGTKLRVSPKEASEFEQNILHAIEFEWFKLKQKYSK